MIVELFDLNTILLVAIFTNNTVSNNGIRWVQKSIIEISEIEYSACNNNILHMIPDIQLYLDIYTSYLEVGWYTTSSRQ